MAHIDLNISLYDLERFAEDQEIKTPREGWENVLDQSFAAPGGVFATLGDQADLKQLAIDPYYLIEGNLETFLLAYEVPAVGEFESNDGFYAFACDGKKYMQVFTDRGELVVSYNEKDNKINSANLKHIKSFVKLKKAAVKAIKKRV